MFCQIGDPQKLEAVLVIDQGDIDYIHTGQKVDVQARRPAARHAAQPHCRDCPDRIEGDAAAVVVKDGRGTGDEDGPELGRGAAAEHVVSSPGAAGQSGRFVAVGVSRTGEDSRRLAAAGRRGSGGC